MPTPKKKAEHQLEDIHYQLRYFGDSCRPPEGPSDLGESLRIEWNS